MLAFELRSWKTREHEKPKGQDLRVGKNQSSLLALEAIPGLTTSGGHSQKLDKAVVALSKQAPPPSCSPSLLVTWVGLCDTENTEKSCILFFSSFQSLALPLCFHQC